MSRTQMLDALGLTWLDDIPGIGLVEEEVKVLNMQHGLADVFQGDSNMMHNASFSSTHIGKEMATCLRNSIKARDWTQQQFGVHAMDPGFQRMMMRFGDDWYAHLQTLPRELDLVETFMASSLTDAEKNRDFSRKWKHLPSEIKNQFRKEMMAYMNIFRQWAMDDLPACHKRAMVEQQRDQIRDFKHGKGVKSVSFGDRFASSR